MYFLCPWLFELLLFQQEYEEGFNQWEDIQWEPHSGFSTEDIYVRSEYEGQHAEVAGIYLLTFCWTLCLSRFHSCFQPLPLHAILTANWYSFLLLLTKIRWKVNQPKTISKGYPSHSWPLGPASRSEIVTSKIWHIQYMEFSKLQLQVSV